MADNVELPPGGGGAVAATDEVSGAHYQRVKLVYGAEGVVAPDVTKTNPYPVDPHNLSAPKYTYTTAVGLAAGGSIDLDSDQISSGKTGLLLSVAASSSVHIKCELKLVTNGLVTGTVTTWFCTSVGPCQFHAPAKHFFQVAHSATAGFDGYRLTVTNLDISQAADVYATFMYDEQ